MDSNRFLKPEEVELLVNISLSSDTRWRILVATQDDSFCAAVINLFFDDEQVIIDRVKTGCDTLISCARHNPDLLVLDSELPDLRSSFVIDSIRHDKDLRTMRILCHLNGKVPPDVAGLLANDFILENDDLDKVYLSRKLHTLLYTADSNSDAELKASNERRWPRTRLHISAQIGVCGSDFSEPLLRSEATVENISFGGAYISGMQFEKIPMVPGASRLMLNIDQPHLPGFTADSILLRYRPNGSAGIRFLNMSKDDRLKLLGLFEE